ncbi:hypothetical protein vBEliSR6L_107 [Erythrobacter phage vB_EliS_R6L]|nr:hypothetical protein vBEliSR6L_107 [Erythrobacter phage vB_EliS_R6L]
MTKLTLSTRFLNDRSDRGLPVGEMIKEGAQRSSVRAPRKIAEDMIDDAAYQGWFTDAEPYVVRPARSAFRALVKQGVTYRKGVRFENDLARPGDA